jgi:hypothetical protein
MTSIEPINSMPIHIVLSWHVLMVIINGFGVVIWPMWVVLSQICGWGVTQISHDLPNFWAKIGVLPDDIHRANKFHAHPYHHLLTCPDGDNQWFWGGHLAHVGRAIRIIREPRRVSDDEVWKVRSLKIMSYPFSLIWSFVSYVASERTSQAELSILDTKRRI